MPAYSFSTLRLNLVLTHGIPPDVHGGVYIFYHHTPSGQTRVYRVTQLRTDGLHCRESAGTGPVVLRVVRVRGAVFASQWTNYYCAPLFSHTLYWYKVSIMFKLSGVYQNICTAVLLYCCTVLCTHFLHPFYVCTSVKGQVYTVQYHPLFVKTLSRLYYFCTVDLFPPDLCLID